MKRLTRERRCQGRSARSTTLPSPRSSEPVRPADELAEAQAWIANDEPLMNAGRPLATGRVRELVDILAELEPDDDEDGRGAPAAVGSGVRCPGTRGARRSTSHLGQCSLRFGTRGSNCSMSAVCGGSPLNVSTPPFTEIATWSPSRTLPARIISASGS